jgi:SET domain-containing protein
MYCILKTKEKGYGVFLNKHIANNTNIGPYIVTYKNSKGRELPNGYWEEELGRFCNHSFRPNCEMRLIGDDYNLFSIGDINCGDELVVNYCDVEKLLKVAEGRFFDNFPDGPKLIDFGLKSI